MGANVSSQSQKAVTDVVQSIMTNVNTTTNNNMSTIQKNEIILRVTAGNITGSTITQTANSTMKSDVKMSSQVTVSNEQSNQLTAAITNTLSQDSAQKNSGINFGAVNTSLQSSESKTNTKNIIQNTINNAINNYCDTTQQGNILITLDAGNITNSNITQSATAVLDQIVDYTTNDVISNVLKNTAAADIANDFKQKNIQANAGLDPAAIFGIIVAACIVAGLMGLRMTVGGISGMKNFAVDHWRAILIGCLILGVISVIVVVFVLPKPKKPIIDYRPASAADPVPKKKVLEPGVQKEI